MLCFLKKKSLFSYTCPLVRGNSVLGFKNCTQHEYLGNWYVCSVSENEFIFSQQIYLNLSEHADLKAAVLKQSVLHFMELILRFTWNSQVTSALQPVIIPAENSEVRLGTRTRVMLQLYSPGFAHQIITVFLFSQSINNNVTWQSMCM